MLAPTGIADESGISAMGGRDADRTCVGWRGDR